MGTGGHSKIVADILNLSGRDLLGFVTQDKDVKSEYCFEKILGDDSFIYNYSPDEIELVNGLGSLHKKKKRWELADKLRERGYSFATIIHPSSIIASTTSLDEGAQIMAGVIIQPGTKIGKDSIINTGAVIDHDCNIAEKCHIAPGVVCSGGVKVGEGTNIGTGSSIINNINIGKNCTIAAGSVIFKNVEDNIIFIQKKYCLDN